MAERGYRRLVSPDRGAVAIDDRSEQAMNRFHRLTASSPTEEGQRDRMGARVLDTPQLLA